jgi:hypothetical protein
MTTTTISMGNNETLSIGVFAQANGMFLAMTLSASRLFKTRRGAEAWLARRAA